MLACGEKGCANMYTVKQLSDLAGVSVRTLHHYDHIGLLKPSALGGNGYRYYDEDALLRLQQILFYRELDLELAQISLIISQPDFDLKAALLAHRRALRRRIERLRDLITTIDTTIQYLDGEADMSKKQMFSAFSDEQQKEYEQQAKQLWDADKVTQSVNLWNSYSQAQKQQIADEGNAIYTDLVDAMATGPASPEVQAILRRWHQHLRYFYEPTPEILRGLGHGYNQHPDFHANFARLHPDLPAFLEQAITYYCDHL